MPIDIMDQETGRFICTLRMPVNPLFQLKAEDIGNFILEKRPTLKYRKIDIIIDYDKIPKT